jgi:hypothetical protein
MNPNAMGTLQIGEYIVGYFNGDARADLMWIGNAGNIHVRMMNSGSMNLSTLQNWKAAGQLGSLNSGGEYLIGDLNCDGKEDVLHVDPNNNQGTASYVNSTASGLTSNVIWIQGGTFGNRANGEYQLGYHSGVQLNGKKCADLLFIHESGRVDAKNSNGSSFGYTYTPVYAGAFGRLVDGGQYQ